MRQRRRCSAAARCRSIGWHYPPFFFAIAVLVAAVPYAWGLAIWLVASFAAYLAAMRAILPRPETLLVAAAFPAVFVNIGHGQNGFLTAALLGGALHLARSPAMACGRADRPAWPTSRNSAC